MICPAGSVENDDQVVSQKSNARSRCLKDKAISLAAKSLLLCSAGCTPATVECVTTDPTCQPALIFMRTAALVAAGGNSPANPWLSYDPLSIAGLRLWVRAEGISQGDNTPLASWTDLSGTG